MVKIIAFDLDGTLTESKQKIDEETILLLNELSTKYKVIIISGGPWKQFKNQLLKHIKWDKPENIFLMPTSGSILYEWNGFWWKKIYQEKISYINRKLIKSKLKKINDLFLLGNFATFKEQYEDRKSQITFSACGQNAELWIKNKWSRIYLSDKMNAQKYLQNQLPNFEVKLGGLTSIDITKEGIDKAYGITKIRRYLKLNFKDFLFIGDGLFLNGNDYPIKQLGIKCIKTSGPNQTKKIIKNILTKK